MRGFHGASARIAKALHAPWFPTVWADLQDLRNRTLSAGSELQCDHPGFSDPVYRKRRMEVAEIAANYEGTAFDGGDIPRLVYTESEIATWNTIYVELLRLYETLACEEHMSSIRDMEKSGIIGPRIIPQLGMISQHLHSKTGFVVRPVCGLLSSRDFLNALAFRTFCSTQYIRHGSVPFYTPEPDVVHELLGHVPMFLNPDYADFTQCIGLASLGASDEDIKRLASCYWFGAEFGLLRKCRDKKSLVAFGAGILSSVSELRYSTGDLIPKDLQPPKICDFDPFAAANTPYPITSMQSLYFVSDSLAEAKERMIKFCDVGVSKGFTCIYDKTAHRVTTDIDVIMDPR